MIYSRQYVVCRLTQKGLPIPVVVTCQAYIASASEMTVGVSILAMFLELMLPATRLVPVAVGPSVRVDSREGHYVA